MRISWRAPMYCAVGAINVLSALLPVWPWRFLVLRHRLRLPLPLILGAQDITLFALRALGVVDARARGLVVSVIRDQQSGISNQGSRGPAF